jgi:AraC-like DNA-binding protein
VTEVLLYQGSGFALGEFRCTPDDPRWRQENDAGPRAVAAFPITSVVIRHAGHDGLLANANHVVFYRGGDRYHRVLHDARGDHCLFVEFDVRSAARLLASAGTALLDLPFVHGPSRARQYLCLRAAASLARSGGGEALAIEETICDALSSAVEAGLDLHRVRRAARAATVVEHARLVESAKHLLTERATEHDSLTSLASSLHVSEFHLARAFRAGTGFTLHGYRTHLRLRAALDLLTSSPDRLSAIATELGFNSHSHFTDAFHSTFGASPSEVRATTGRRGLAELRRILEAPAGPPS